MADQGPDAVDNGIGLTGVAEAGGRLTREPHDLPGLVEEKDPGTGCQGLPVKSASVRAGRSPGVSDSEGLTGAFGGNTVCGHGERSCLSCF